MQTSTIRYGRNLQYAIIGRLKREHDAYGLDPDQIKNIIAIELMPFVDASDIKHVPPNYIICLDCPQAQQNILAEGTLETHHFQLQLLPWSYEHEWAQLPWITAPGTEGSTVLVNPLDILPVVPDTHKRRGVQTLKDSFAQIIPKYYDLQAPNLSYMLITELRDFYTAKFAAFMESKRTATLIHQTLFRFVDKAEQQIEKITAYIQQWHSTANLNVLDATACFIDGLKTAIKSTDMPLSQLDAFMKAALSCKNSPLNLDGFTEGPPAIEIPVPLRYADRLKTIYRTAVEQIHRTTPIIETIMREENRYETYITVAGFTRRYHGPHSRNAAGMEAAALFYALKHLTNVQGYKIIDLNYPTLQRLVSDIDAWNLQINKFQLYGTIALRQVEKMFNNLSAKCQSAELSDIQVLKSDGLIHASNVLLYTLENIYGLLSDLCDSLTATKATYHAVRVGIYSPTGSVYHWARATRPSPI